jgi:hypothetical protein
VGASVVERWKLTAVVPVGAVAVLGVALLASQSSAQTSGGQTCRPPESAGVAPGFGNTMLNSIITGGTGRFQHAVGTLTVSVVSHPPIVTLYHTIGAFVGVEPSH